MVIEAMFRVPFVISRETVIALAVIIVGVCIYESRDLAFSIAAVAAITVNMAFAVVERLMQRHLMSNSPVELSKPTMMLLNNGIGALPCVALACLWGEHAKWKGVFGTIDVTSVLLLILSCVIGLAISYAGLRLQQKVAATTFMVITNVNKFAVIGFGILVFGDTAGPFALTGCSMAILGGVLYGEARKRAEQAPSAAAKLPEEAQLLGPKTVGGGEHTRSHSRLGQGRYQDDTMPDDDDDDVDDA
eukprot:CAMPEP_0206034154 /NCGR_PEP_ID=MMETSP1466-20131121/1159_1 /ASSEMBLY_ACC=CAM_ASM_001126 /TAXON_ID=44452 /ORGANISM="Pavlova gyrans, Strain CCMP608" /LENGTH=245 /DNA_ID=CAMNT_0053408415 /DNA_START=39 /DNA_END=773 /DNA_ORIENTATION=+